MELFDKQEQEKTLTSRKSFSL